MYSDMSRRTSACSLSKRNSASARASSVFPTPVGPRKMNEPIGRFGSLMPARARSTAMEMLGEMEQLVAVALDELRDRDPGPPRHHLGDVLFVDLLLEEPLAAAVVLAAERRFLLGELPLELHELPVLQ